ncbi:MAG: DUF2285 domain-containing protein [Hyphomicrobiaceae bacterium]
MTCRWRRAGDCIPFVDPGLSALDAPVCWLPDTGAAALTASSSFAPVAADADLALDRLTSVQHIVVASNRIQRLLVHSTDCALALELHGDKITSGPVNLTFHIHRVALATAVAPLFARLPSLLFDAPRRRVVSARRNLLRDALIALDGRQVGASYRETAVVAYGPEWTTAAWSGSSRALKDHMIRAYDKGLVMSAGGYRQLLK